MRLTGTILDPLGGRRLVGVVEIEGGRIVDVREDPTVDPRPYVLPGLVDAHLHVESSMLPPAELARLAVAHGTVGAVCDPHEIANVCGLDGVRYMLESARDVPFCFAFGAPSCVPATTFETAGATLDAPALRELFADPRVSFLSEVMNYPGVIGGDAGVLSKLALARELGVPIDGHAPGVTGEALRRYAAQGISTDHECSTLDEALEKLAAGMLVIVREGSAAKNFEALHSLISSHPERCMLGSDDRHPDDLAEGHIDALVRRALAKGHELLDVLRVACVNPVLHYRLPLGLLRPGDRADLVVVDDPTTFRIARTFVAGRLVAERGRSLLERKVAPPIAPVRMARLAEGALVLRARSARVRVIGAEDGQLLTREVLTEARLVDGELRSRPAEDVLKLVVVNRYSPAPPAIAFVRGFGLTRGAIASSVAHDSHNVVAVGVDDRELLDACNAVIDAGGGVAVCGDGSTDVLPLPIAGLMSPDDGYAVARAYRELDRRAKSLGSALTSPFMTLSFMALLVIPALKLSDRGLFDGVRFEPTTPLLG